MNTRHKIGLGALSLGAAAYGYNSLTWTSVFKTAVVTTADHVELKGLALEKERALIGKLVRPVFPTNVEEISAYISLSSAAKGVQIAVIGGGVAGTMSGAALGYYATKGVAHAFKRLLFRVLLLPPLSIVGGTAVSIAAFAKSLYSVMEKSTVILAPVPPASAALLEKALPQAVVDKMRYKGGR
jgi:hypothetical protein